MTETCINCKSNNNCVFCYIGETYEKNYKFIMSEDNIQERIRSCKCYLCIEPRSVTCVELQYYMKGYSVEQTSAEIQKIKNQ